MKKMLIIDDEYLVRIGIQETIDWVKHDIEIIATATNGKEGLKLIEELHPDIIISDVRMPIMDGLDLMKAINQKEIDAIVIMLSGYKDFEYAKETLENGAFQYLLKPIDNEQLVESVLNANEELEKRRASQEKVISFEKEIPLITTTIIQNLITGNYSDISELNQKIEDYNINIPESGFVIYGQVDQEEENDKSSIKRANASLYNIVQQGFNGLSFLSNIYYSHFVFLIGGVEMTVLLDKLSQCLNSYETLHSELISIGISSNYQTLASIYESYLEAKKNAQNKLLLTMNTITTSQDKHTNYRRLIVDTIRYISKHYHENITVQSVARKFDVSQSHLMHLFKEDVGQTFNECLTEYRMRIAKKLLLTEKYRVYEIASMVGYSDTKYFSQVFRKSEGVAPIEYVTTTKKIG